MMIFVIVLALAAYGSVQQVEGGDAIQGYYHAWWAIVPLPKTTVQKMLPVGRRMVLGDVSLPGLPVDHHPVVLEIGVEHQAGPIGIPKWLLPTFPEFKLDIPYLTVPNTPSQSLNYKSIIYTDSDILNIASQLQYNLNALTAQIESSDTTYKVVFDGRVLTASFNASGGYRSSDQFPNFSDYEEIMSQTWFGSHKADRKTCADHHYQYDTIQVRPASMYLKADQGVLDENFPDSDIRTPDLTTALGTVEILAHFTISSPYDCLP